MLNKVMLIGRLGRDPELRYAANGNAICSLRLATDESYTDRDGNKVEKAEWHTVICFQRQAENCKTYLAKGSLIYVEGSLQTRKWQAQDGSDRYSTEIKANIVKFLDRKSDSQGQGDSAPQGQQPRQQQRRPYSENDDLGPAFPSEPSGMDDVPFNPEEAQPL